MVACAIDEVTTAAVKQVIGSGLLACSAAMMASLREQYDSGPESHCHVRINRPFPAPSKLCSDSWCLLYKTPVDGVAVAVEEAACPLCVVAFAAVTLACPAHCRTSDNRGRPRDCDRFRPRRSERAASPVAGGIAAAAAVQKPTECTIAPVTQLCGSPTS